MGRDGHTPVLRLLTRLFIRRLLDNDLISPHADRHESLAVLYAVVVSLAVFVTFFVATPYLSAFVQLPGPTALSALADRFLFVAASMAVCALAALLVWDALALESRDAAILGPLPIASSTITCAKLAAALVFGAVFSIAVNAVPSVLYPAFLTANLRGISGAGVLRLMAAQAITVVMAGLFGFFGVLAVRGVLRLALGARGFGRVSSVAQSTFIVCAVTALILTPTLGAPALRDWITGVGQPRWPARPVLWHIGVNEAIAGDVVVDTPVVMPPRLTLRAPLQQQDAEARLAYRSLTPHLKTLARTAWLILPLVTILAIVTFLWNNRRLPEQSARRPPPSRARAGVRTLVERLTHRDPEARAGFFFTLQTLTRSAPHRIIVAVSVAVAVTFPFITMVRGIAHGQVETASMPLGLFGIQIMVLSSLVAGVRYAVMVPAELAANWTFRMAWRGDERIYLKGVKRAALLRFGDRAVARAAASARRALRDNHRSRSFAVRAAVRSGRLGRHLPGIPTAAVCVQLSAAWRRESALASWRRDPAVGAVCICIHRAVGAAVAAADSGARRVTRRDDPRGQDRSSRPTPRALARQLRRKTSPCDSAAGTLRADGDSR